MLGPTVKSCDRVFDILELFSQHQKPLRLRDIAGALQLPVSSAAALTKSMTARHYLRFNQEARTYFPTSRLGSLTNWITPGDVFEEVTIRAAMQQVQRATNELIVLGTDQDIHLQYVDTLRSMGGTQLYAAPGTRRVLVLTAGWLLLQNRTHEEALDIYRRSVQCGIVDPQKMSEAAFLRGLEQHRGVDVCHARARDFKTPTAHWDGAMTYSLLPVPSGHRRLVIGVGGPAERIEAKRTSILAALSQCRLEVSTKLSATQQRSAPGLRDASVRPGSPAAIRSDRHSGGRIR